MKNIRKAVVLGALVACVALVLAVVVKSLRGGGSMPAWTASPIAFTDGPALFSPPPFAWPTVPYEYQDGGYYQDQPYYTDLPATQMPTTVPTEPSPMPLGGPFILPAGS